MPNIKLRSAEQMNRMNEHLASALKSLAKAPGPINLPIVYQYSQRPNEVLEPDKEQQIGTVKDIWMDAEGNCYCKVEIFHAISAAREFDSIIDNISAKMIPDKQLAEVDAFVIYNKEAKRLIQERHRQEAIERQQELSSMGQKMAKEGAVPLDSDVDMNDIAEVSRQLIDQFKKSMEP